MLNRFPMWKNLMVLLVVIIGVLYSAPNLYGEDPAVQVSAARGVELKVSTLDDVKKLLQDNKLQFKSAAFAQGQVLVRFTSTEDQLKAKELISEQLGEQYIVALNLAPATPAWLSAIGAGPLKLGLDLRGGVHFLMEVDMAEAISKAQDQLVQDFRAELREQNIRYAGVRLEGDAVLVQFRDKDAQQAGLAELRKRHKDLQLADTEVNGQFRVTASLTEAKLREIKESALEQNITIIRNRVNELGVAEPLVQRQGAERIVVELPGIQDTARAKEILGATATLEFRQVDDTADLASAAAGRVPANSQLYKDRNGRPVVLQKRVILTGNHIVDAQSGMDEYSRPQVSISLDSQGGNKMSTFTKDSVGKSMATVFIEFKPVGEPGPDGKRKFRKHEEVVNVATIQSRLGSNFRITGIDNVQEAHNLSLLLRAGALIAPIQIVEERTIGPSLGQQNIESGLKAMAFGMSVLVLFMAIYYRKFGLVANLALIFNVVLLVGIMSLIPGATMTLPGIAGIVLTLGMAVDANVLIFERIREELANGARPKSAIVAGFNRAFTSIFDAQITTLLVAFILFAIGTGPIKGFAVTLAIGIASSIFTSVTVTRALVQIVYGYRKSVKKLSIG